MTRIQLGQVWERRNPFSGKSIFVVRNFSPPGVILEHIHYGTHKYMNPQEISDMEMQADSGSLYSWRLLSPEETAVILVHQL